MIQCLQCKKYTNEQVETVERGRYKKVDLCSVECWEKYQNAKK